MNLTTDLYQCIDIVLAVFDGEKYLAKQLESIRNNIGYHYLVRKIIVVDDGSADGSLSLLHHERHQDPKLDIVPALSPSLGAMLNFSRGALLSQAKFVMFCDQDDYWFEHKIVDTLSAILSDHDEQTAKLVFSDLQIVDENLALISSSYFLFKKITISWHDELSNLVKQNVASGCTMMLNRALLLRAFPLPVEAYMHDWWLALVAKMEGELIFVNKPLLLYRQHEKNTIGAGVNKKYHLLNRAKRFVTSVDKSILQTKKLISLYPKLVETQPDISIFAQLPETPLFTKLSMIIKGKYKRSSFSGSLGMFIYVLFFVNRYSKRAYENRTH